MLEFVSGEDMTGSSSGFQIAGWFAEVSFERNPRIAAIGPEPGAMGRSKASLPISVPARKLWQKRGFETAAEAPARSPLEGEAVVVSEE